MIATGLMFDDFDLVVYSSQPPCMDGIITVINDALTVTLQSFCIVLDLRAVRCTELGHTITQESSRPGARLGFPVANIDSKEKKIVCSTQSGYQRPPWVIFLRKIILSIGDT